MARVNFICFWISLAMGGIFAGLAQAETIELVTYFPAGGGGGGGGGDQQMRSLRVGNAYANDPVLPGDGVARIFDSLGIGIPVGAGEPVGSLDVRGTPGVFDPVSFVPGAGGTLAVGIGRQPGNVFPRVLDVLGDVLIQHPQGGNNQVQIRASSAGNQNAGIELMSIDVGGSQPYIDFANNLQADFDIRLQMNNPDSFSILGGNVGIASNNPRAPLQVGASSLFVQADQGGNLEIGGSGEIANPIVNGTPYIDFHFGRGAGVVEDFNARLINRADGILDVQTSTGGAAAQTRLSIGNNIGVGTTIPQTISPQNNVNTGNLDANDVFLRSRGQWLSQAAGGRFLGAANVANFGNFVNFNATETVIGQITVTATGRPLLIVVSHIVCNANAGQRGFQSRIRLGGTGINGAIVIQHGGGVQGNICEGDTLVCVHTPAAGQRTYFFTLSNGTNNNVLRGQATQISVTELGQ